MTVETDVMIVARAECDMMTCKVILRLKQQITATHEKLCAVRLPAPITPRSWLAVCKTCKYCLCMINTK